MRKRRRTDHNSQGSMLTPSQVREFWDNGFLTVTGVFTPAQVAATRRLIEPMFQDFAADGRGRTKDVDIGAIAGRPPGSEQPEIDKPTRRQPALVQTQMYEVTRELACSLLGRPAPKTHVQGLQTHQRTASLHPHMLSTAPPLSRSVPCVLNEGDLTVHHPLTLHYAGANNSPASRTAWGIHFGPYGRLAYLTPRNLLGVIRRRLGSTA